MVGDARRLFPLTQLKNDNVLGEVGNPEAITYAVASTSANTFVQGLDKYFTIVLVPSDPAGVVYDLARYGVRPLTLCFSSYWDVRNRGVKEAKRRSNFVAFGEDFGLGERESLILDSDRDGWVAQEREYVLVSYHS